MQAQGHPLKVGQRVVVAQRIGTVRFNGATKFAAGNWIGVELDEAVGKNNGKVQGVEYFSCPPEHGIFVRDNLVKPLEEAEAAGEKFSKPKARARQSVAAGKVTPAAAKAAPAGGMSLLDKLMAPEPGNASSAAPAQDERKSASTDESPLKKSVPMESPKQAMENKIKKLRPQVEEARQDLEKEGNQLEDAEKRLAAAKATADAAAGTADSETSKAAEDLREARAAKARIRDDVDRRRSQFSTLEEAASKLKHEHQTAREKAFREAADEITELTRQLAKLELSRELEEHRAAEISLDLEELRLRREEEKIASRSLLNGKGQQSPFSANSDLVAEYQSALHVLSKCCVKDKEAIQQRADHLEKASAALNGLRRSEQVLTAKREELTTDILDMDRQVAELSQLMKVGSQLQDEQMSMTTELRRQLDSCDGRVSALEGLVKKLHRERLEVENSITKDATSATELSQQVQQLASQMAKARGEAGDQVADHARVVSAAVRRRLAALSAAAARARAEAYIGGMPDGWGQSKPSLGKVSQAADVISVVEASLCRAEALTTHICTRLLAALPHGSDTVARWLCALCLVSGSCAAAAAAALTRLRACGPDEADTKKGPFEVTIIEREGNLGLSVKGVPPAKTLPVEKVAPGSLAEKHGVQPGCILLAVQRKPTEHMTLEVFKTVMKQRPLTLLLRHPLVSNSAKAADLKLDLDQAICNKARQSLDELIAACRTGNPEPQPQALESLSSLEEQLLALERAAPGKPPDSASRCATALALRRIEAVYRFGINVGPAISASSALAEADREAEAAGEDEAALSRAVEKRVAAQQVQVREELAKHLGETATRLLAAEAGREFSLCAGQLYTLDDPRLLSPAVLKALLDELQSLEASLRAGGEGILVELDRAATAISASLEEVIKVWPPPNKLHMPHLHVTMYSAMGAPGWTMCASGVQGEIDAVFDAQRSVVDGRASLVVKRTAAEESAQRLARETAQRTELKDKVDKLRQKCEQCNALDAEAADLYAQAKKDTSAQAELELKLDNARASREEQERAARDSAAKLSETDRMLEERRKRPREELEGRATAQELATLKHTSVKGARELYAMQVDAVKNLEPLPSLAPMRSAPSQALESCVSKYAELRRELLTDFTRVRLDPLPMFPTKMPGQNAMLESAKKKTLGRLQDLQLQLAELKAQASSLVEPLPGGDSSRQSTPALKNNPPVKVRLEIPCPKWVTLAPKVQGPLEVSLEELQAIHRVAVA